MKCLVRVPLGTSVSVFIILIISIFSFHHEPAERQGEFMRYWQYIMQTFIVSAVARTVNLAIRLIDAGFVSRYNLNHNFGRLFLFYFFSSRLAFQPSKKHPI